MSQAKKKKANAPPAPVKVVASDVPYTRDLNCPTLYSNNVSVVTTNDEVQLIFGQTSMAPDGRGNRAPVAVDVAVVFMRHEIALKLADAIQRGNVSHFDSEKNPHSKGQLK